uniref:Uncharacterized protein n=1 Tax=Clytia hemisphaerica TaxID=252671 RepID=A0A7M5XAA6_9CNID
MDSQNPSSRQITFKVQYGENRDTDLTFVEDEETTVLSIKYHLVLKLDLPIENQCILRKVNQDWIYLRDNETLVFTSDIEHPTAETVAEIQIDLKCLAIKEHLSLFPFADDRKKSFVFPKIRVLPKRYTIENNVIEIGWDEFQRHHALCTLKGFQAMICDKLNTDPNESLLLYIESFKERSFLKNTERWLETLNEYGVREQVLDVYIGVFSQPSNTVQQQSNSSNILRLPFIKVCNTRDEEIAKWYPDSKSCDTVNLMTFIQNELEIPLQNQVLYHAEKKLTRSTNLTSLLITNAYSIDIHVAYKTFPKAPGKELSERSRSHFEELRLQEVRSMTIKDLDTNWTIVENALVVMLNPSAGYGEIVHVISDKLGENFIYDLSKSGKTLYRGLVIEELFYNGGVFSEDIELKCSLNYTKAKPGEDQDCDRRMYGFKKLVIKSLTKVIELDVSTYNTLDKLRRFIESEWGISKRCQVYMTKDRKIGPDSNESLLMLYKHITTEEERKRNALYFNLITLEPKNVTVYLNCPYGERIGMPETVDILETSTVKDLENRLSEMMNIQISVFPRNLPDQYNNDEFSLPKDRVHLFSLISTDVTESLSLRVFRTLKALVHVKCRKCGKDETLEKRVTVKDRLNLIQDVYTIQDVVEFLTRKFQEYRCSSYGFCQRQNLKLSKKDNILNLTSESTLADLPVDYVLNFKTFCNLRSFMRGAFKKEPAPWTCSYTNR